MDKSEPELLWQLTTEQRHEVYEQEKRRIEESAPAFSKRTKFFFALYILGCVLLYFGIPQSFIDFCGTRQWTYQPEKDIFVSIVNGAIELIRPFLAVLICFWFLLIPIGIVWFSGGGLLKFVKKLIKRCGN